MSVEKNKKTSESPRDELSRRINEMLVSKGLEPAKYDLSKVGTISVTFSRKK